MAPRSVKKNFNEDASRSERCVGNAHSNGLKERGINARKSEVKAELDMDVPEPVTL